MKKTRIAICLLLFLLLFMTMNVTPAHATIPALLDVFALKEYKRWSSYNPSYTFSKSTDTVLRMMSTTSGIGDAYIFLHIEKDYLNGKKLRISWRWYYDWSGTFISISQLYVVNNVHNRKLENSGEFRTQGDIEHPIADYTSINPLSLYATSNGGWINWATNTSGVLNLNSFTSSVVTILIRTGDAWISETTGFEVDYLQILDSNNNVLRTYHFTSLACMDKTGGYYDYGLVRKPTGVLYGTRNYADMDAPAGECDLSGDVSAYVYTLFYNTGKYAYLANSWGANTEPSTVYSTTDSTERYYDYSMVFYKGHIWNFSDSCDEPSCALLHYGIWDDDGEVEDMIADYRIGNEVREVIDDNDKFAGTHDFVFIWACGHGNESMAGIVNGTHSSGLLASWMHLDPADPDLSHDGYAYPDGSDHVYISFQWLSIWYKTPTTDTTYNYGHWAYLFFYYALQGSTINEALDQASIFTHDGANYDNCPLDNGYLAWNPIDETWDWSKMRVWGDGTTRLPR